MRGALARPFLAIVFGCAACHPEVLLVDATTDDVFLSHAERRPASVLFVIDDSASMQEEQARLGRDLHAMTDVLADAAADVQLGVVTTDISGLDRGVLRGGVLAPGDGAALEAAIAAGTDGSRDEQGIAAITLAVDGRNPGFAEGERTLEVIVFSDEDDHGTQDTLDAYLALFDAFGSDVRIHGVVGDPPSGCFSPDGAADAGTRYVDLIARTAGYRESICAPDYAGLLGRLGLELVGITDTFFLSRVPVVDTIAVVVDGEDVAADPDTGWTYEPGPNAVVFHGPSIPSLGQEVTVSYQRLAGASR
ncbi:MAG: hypothetical protein H6733_10875 [Alphaproteobacteria bacterium]|nr:hypothetical protein [Alphaproteobacteria bacterium]